VPRLRLVLAVASTSVGDEDSENMESDSDRNESDVVVLDDIEMTVGDLRTRNPAPILAPVAALQAPALVRRAVNLPLGVRQNETLTNRHANDSQAR